MRDPRTDPYTDDEQTAAYVAEFGDPRLPPTHPNGPRKMRDVRPPEHVNEPCHVEPALDRAAFYGPGIDMRRDLPAPPPADVNVEPSKWMHMSRAERRALLRGMK